MLFYAIVAGRIERLPRAYWWNASLLFVLGGLLLPLQFYPELFVRLAQRFDNFG